MEDSAHYARMERNLAERRLTTVVTEIIRHRRARNGQPDPDDQRLYRTTHKAMTSLPRSGDWSMAPIRFELRMAEEQEKAEEEKR